MELLADADQVMRNPRSWALIRNYVACIATWTRSIINNSDSHRSHSLQTRSSGFQNELDAVVSFGWTFFGRKCLWIGQSECVVAPAEKARLLIVASVESVLHVTTKRPAAPRRLLPLGRLPPAGNKGMRCQHPYSPELAP